MRVYDSAGRDGLVAFIDERTGDARLAGWRYGLADASFNRLAGNLPHWPDGLRPRTQWSEFVTIDIGAGETGKAPLRATYRKLPDGSQLLLGRPLDGLDGFTGRMAAILAAAGGLFFVLAAAAGASTARRSVTRIETINNTSREIMRSGLGKRIPLRGTGDEWDELAANLNSMLDRIEQLVETNRQVSDNIAHDLRTPLTRMRARLERATTEPHDGEGYRRVVQVTIAELDGVLRTFASLLRISRIEASDDTTGFRRLDLTKLAGEVIELFDASAEENAVRLLYSADPNVVVFGDRDLLFDALSNLVDNAIKHGGGGDVAASVAAGDDGAVFVVADRGPGIPPSERARVFERFYRLERSRKSPGNGLGLSLVAAVAKLHNSHIELTDNAPGLCARLYFPLPPARAPVDGAYWRGAADPAERSPVAAAARDGAQP